jgi:signal transduction histidine kinase
MPNTLLFKRLKLEILRSSKPFRIGLILLIVSIFGLIDWILTSKTLRQAVFEIRYLMMCPVLLLCFICSFINYFKIRFSQIGMTTYLVLLFGAIGIMLQDTNGKIFSVYRHTLPIIIGFSPAILSMSKRASLFSSLIGVVSFNFFFFPVISSEELIFDNAFILTASVLGCFCRVTEINLLDRINAKVDIIRRHRKHLLKAKIQLSIISDTNSRLIGIMSHDIKGPLTSIEGLLSLYNNRMVAVNEIDSYFKKLELLTANTNLMLSNMLQWSSFYQNSGELKFTTFDLVEVVRNTIESVTLIATFKNNVIIQNIPNGTLVRGDKDAITMVIRNLISNANKFTSDGKIIVEAKNKNGSVVISVTDTGVGMPETRVSEIMKPFKVQSNNGTMNEKGTGMGLMFCKDFIQRHESRLECLSITEKGTSFSFHLPLSA